MSTLRRALDLKREGVAGVGETNQCYSTNPAAVTLRVHGFEGADWLFSWTHFAHAKLTSIAEKEKLALTFLSHEISFTGSSLKSIVDAVALYELESIRMFPAEYQAGVPKEPFIDQIHISPIDG